MSISGRDAVWFPGLLYLSMESFHADWLAPSCGIVDAPAEVDVWYVDVPEMDILAVLLENDAVWTQGVGSVDPRRIETWAQY